MTAELVELRQLLSAARRYLDGDCAIQELNGRVAQLADAAKFWGQHPSLAQLAAEWSAMIDRRWNEWGHSHSPISESEFSSWLQSQLSASPIDP